MVVLVAAIAERTISYPGMNGISLVGFSMLGSPVSTDFLGSFSDLGQFRRLN